MTSTFKIALCILISLIAQSQSKSTLAQSNTDNTTTINQTLFATSSPMNLNLEPKNKIEGKSNPIALSVKQTNPNLDDPPLQGVSQPVTIQIPQNTTPIIVLPTQVDKNTELEIPVTNNVSLNAFALIIGNEDYKSYQTGLSTEQNVEFALNDAKLFKNICNKTLGVPNENIIYLENASFVKIKQAISQFELVCKYSKEKPTLYFYYSGHGLPDEQTKIPYLIPVDVSGTSFEYAISLPELYKSLTIYPSEKVVMFLDACFTGEARNTGLIASRGVKIIPKKEELTGNLVVYSASSSDQPSKAYKEKQHGLFTYYLAQKIIETKGGVTLGELDEYLFENVPLKSVLINKSEQVPFTNTSPDIEQNWKDWRLN